MSDTPETDRNARTWGDAARHAPNHDWELVRADFARKLERERDEARRLAEQYLHWSCETQQEADEEKLPWEQ